MRALILIVIFTFTLQADPPKDSRKIVYTNIIGSSAIIAWGVLNWDYGKKSMHTSSEGWFSKNTKSGGADKMGHLYTTFALSNYLTNLYEKFGYEKKRSIKAGAISSFILNSVMEIGDSFSDYGFSYEDFIFNAIGSYAGYYLLTNPDVDRVLDIRLEYKPSKKITNGESIDILTDYNGMKFLMALKFNEIPKIKNSFLKYFEFHLGYYTRKKSKIIKTDPYVAIGVNLSYIISPISKKVSNFLNYYQVPYSYLEF